MGLHTPECMAQPRPGEPASWSVSPPPGKCERARPWTVQPSRPSSVHSGSPPPAPAHAHGRPPRPPPRVLLTDRLAAAAPDPATRSHGAAACFSSLAPGPEDTTRIPTGLRRERETVPRTGSACGFKGNSPRGTGPWDGGRSWCGFLPPPPLLVAALGVFRLRRLHALPLWVHVASLPSSRDRRTVPPGGGTSPEAEQTFLCDRAGEAPPPGAFPGRAPSLPPLRDAGAAASGAAPGMRPPHRRVHLSGRPSSPPKPLVREGGCRREKQDP